MAEKKTISVGVRLSEVQNNLLLQLVQEGKAKTISQAIHYLINQQIILGDNK
ncbi:MULTISPECIES: hypothetical protein [Enterobacteriaceae]|uniref:hypothetical protein n=1 Tax=Enterobacteriaceae TaxID=543 RepID=UPI001DCEFE6F|nr:hypothetical protein [Citrobacter sp. Cpo090]EHO3777905.1 hypothetical protein [Salmonella enterica]ELJ3586292.1 hypothetical protein [Salmonella enterica]MDM2846691.1 hypothetical protein [Citrobacter sp. Cpo090]HCX6035169.1 hypothetical protein [Escherichia coli]